MFKKMVKLKNKKAFTLIEMMAVVAIVAILVAILVPVIGNSTVKSRAATNAANLRAVEAELATLKVSNPECFVPATKTSGTTLWDRFKSGYIWFYDLVNGENSSSLNFDTVEASAGVLTFHTDNFAHSGDSIDLAGVPTSVAVKADTGMDVPEGGEMIVLLVDNEIRALYKGEGDKYFDKDDFAEVAETGKFTGEGTDSSDGGLLGWLDETFCSEGILHSWEVQGTKHVCKNCGASYTHTDVDVFGVFGRDGECDHCTATCGTDGSGIAHVYDDDGICKGCNRTICAIEYNGVHNYGSDHKCTRCGAIDPDHVCTSWDSNHKCTCGEKHGTSTWVWQNKTYHYCSVGGCEATEKHNKASNDYSWGATTWTQTCSCGATRTVEFLNYGDWTECTELSKKG